MDRPTTRCNYSHTLTWQTETLAEIRKQGCKRISFVYSHLTAWNLCDDQLLHVAFLNSPTLATDLFLSWMEVGSTHHGMTFVLIVSMCWLLVPDSTHPSIALYSHNLLPQSCPLIVQLECACQPCCVHNHSVYSAHLFPWKLTEGSSCELHDWWDVVSRQWTCIWILLSKRKNDH